MSQSQFFRLLFDPGFSTCLTDDKYGTDVFELPLKFYSTEFFSINALKDSRLDANVTCFRNFLIEFDEGSQEEHLEAMVNVPHSTAVYSGGKSTHFIISLEDPLYDAREYKEIAIRIHLLLDGKADPSTKNPSRLSRTPDVLRKDTGKIQDLLFIGQRIENKVLFDMLPDLPANALGQSNKLRPVKTLTSLQSVMLMPDEAMARLNLAGRNALFFWLGQRLTESNYDTEHKRSIVVKTYESLSNKHDFNLTEALSAARLD
jgi:hypothetical protein